jgi:hypothetical protein
LIALRSSGAPSHSRPGKRRHTEIAARLDIVRVQCQDGAELAHRQIGLALPQELLCRAGMRFDLLLLAGDGLGSRRRLGKSRSGACNPNAKASVNDCLDARAHRLPEGSARCGVRPSFRRESAIRQNDKRAPSWSVRPESAAPVICPTVEPPMLVFGMPRLVWLRALVASNRN